MRCSLGSKSQSDAPLATAQDMAINQQLSSQFGFLIIVARNDAIADMAGVAHDVGANTSRAMASRWVAVVRATLANHSCEKPLQPAEPA